MCKIGVYRVGLVIIYLKCVYRVGLVIVYFKNAHFILNKRVELRAYIFTVYLLIRLMTTKITKYLFS